MSESADRFRGMAERIDHNIPAEFGGAAVIVPPTRGGAPVELLILDSSSDPSQFWATVATRIQMAVNKLDEDRKNGFGIIR